MVNWILEQHGLFKTDFGHQGSIKTLWETRWKFPCTLGVYPFHDGKLEDFEPIFDFLIRNNINDPYNDAYTSAFFSIAEDLAKRGEDAESTDKALAIALYKRASTVYRLSRFPYIGTPLKREAFEKQKKVYEKGMRLWDPVMTEVIIPHKYAKEGDGKEIPLYVRMPRGSTVDKPVPVMFLITGLDGHRPDNYERTEGAIERGWATVICDIPGVADCPALKTDPLSPDRYFSAILEWIAENPELDESKVIGWGLSAGGYYAIRAAHTHASQLAGCVGHGAGTHHYIGKEWLAEVDHHEYPFSLKEAYLMKYGYKTWDELLENCQKTFSLVETGIVNMPSTRLLLMNGVDDGCMPIEDSMLLFEYGSPKEARFISKRAHMGYPEANASVWPWLEQVMATAPPKKQ
ncbi:alpha/beta-hydrolase [Rhizodiscina lignyota]|uniref:Alpha/beta-hydrolase n=1 Tax=Rhizodiscina lignyota TaxID=1504668 RepID=A0A9P4M8V2_9PEZI|nr:alpha/beta-hydrolase [Rhizodiscina lignyota]